jgi:hypothetical protein
MVEIRYSYTVLVGKLVGKKPFGVPKRRWNDTVKMNCNETWCEGGNWFQLAQNGLLWKAVALNT